MSAAYFDCTDTSSEGYSPNEDDDCDLDMQFEISDYEPDEVNGIKPYQFEHDFETDSEPASEIDQDANDHHHYEMDDRDADRLHSLEWCDCRCCTILPTIAENRCCEELVRVRETRDDLPQQVRCITEHPGFRSVCLDIYVLLTAFYQYRVLHGEIPESPEGYRYTAYRQFVRWCWGYLGKTIRVPLPSCAVSKIRETFPSPDGEYKGFNFYSD